MFEQVKQEIDNKIKTNGNNEITANRLNGVLQDMMDASAEVIEDVQRSIGDQVEANPTGDATETLSKLKIGETIYEIPQNISNKGLLYGGVIYPETEITPDVNCYYIVASTGYYESFDVTVHDYEKLPYLSYDADNDLWIVEYFDVYTYAYAHGKFDQVTELGESTIQVSSAQEFTDAQRLQALANVSNQEAGYDDSTPPVFTGKMGYVVLQPETQGDATTTFAAQIANKPNTIFEIRDVFDLNNATVQLPQNTTLKFNGGLIKNGVLNGNSSSIEASKTQIFDNVTLGYTCTVVEGETKVAGNWNNNGVYLSWFGCKSYNNSVDNADMITNAVKSSISEIIVDGVYYVSKPVPTATKIFKGESIGEYNNQGFIANTDFEGTDFNHVRSGVTFPMHSDGMFYHQYDQHPIFRDVFINANKVAKYCIEHSLVKDSYSGTIPGNYSNADCYNVNLSNALVAGILQYGCERPVLNTVFVKNCNVGVFVSRRKINESNPIDFTAENIGSPNLVNMTNVRCLNCNYGFVLFNNYNTSMYSCETGYCYLCGIYAENSTLTTTDFYSEGDGMCERYIQDDGTLTEVTKDSNNVALTDANLLSANKDGFFGLPFDALTGDSSVLIYHRSPIVFYNSTVTFVNIITSNYPRGCRGASEPFSDIELPNVRTHAGVDCIILSNASVVNIRGIHKVFVGSGNNPSSKDFFANYILVKDTNDRMTKVNVDYYTRGNGVVIGSIYTASYNDFKVPFIDRLVNDKNSVGVPFNQRQKIFDFSDYEIGDYYNGIPLYKVPRNSNTNNNNLTATINISDYKKYFGEDKQCILWFIAKVIDNPASGSNLKSTVIVRNGSSAVKTIGSFTEANIPATLSNDIIIAPTFVTFLELDNITSLLVNYFIPKEVTNYYLSELMVTRVGDDIPSIQNVAFKPAVETVEVSYNLSDGVTSSNTDTVVDKGKAYITQLTSENEIKEVVVKLGNIDVTNLVYDDTTKVIYIPNAADDIDIKVLAANYLTFTAEEAGSKVKLYPYLTGGANPPQISVETSTDGVNWNSYTLDTEITLYNIGDKVMFRGNNTTLAGSGNDDCNRFVITGKVAASGDVTSLLNGIGGDVTLNLYSFKKLFMNQAGLTQAPNLPSTTLASACYQSMFNNCTGLEEAPELPAAVLPGNCYTTMFKNCSNLVSIKTHMLTIASSSLTDWLSGASATGDFYCDENLDNSYVPSGWTRYNLDDTLWENPNAE